MLVCSGKGEGTFPFCVGGFNLKASSEWTFASKEVDKGKETFQNPNEDPWITCTGACDADGKAIEHPYTKATSYRAVISSPSHKDGALKAGRLIGLIHLELIPDKTFPCTKSSAWDMYLKYEVDIGRIFLNGTLNEDRSDYDGDETSNRDELKAKTDPLDPASE